MNLIVFNPHSGTNFEPSTPERVYAFRSILIQASHSEGGGVLAASRAGLPLGLLTVDACLFPTPTHHPPTHPASQQGTHVATVKDSRGYDQMDACQQSYPSHPPPPPPHTPQGGHVATVRDSRGDDQMAACGQLGSPETSERRPPLLAPPERLRGVAPEGIATA